MNASRSEHMSDRILDFDAIAAVSMSLVTISSWPSTEHKSCGSPQATHFQDRWSARRLGPKFRFRFTGRATRVHARMIFRPSVLALSWARRCVWLFACKQRLHCRAIISQASHANKLDCAEQMTREDRPAQTGISHCACSDDFPPCVLALSRAR